MSTDDDDDLREQLNTANEAFAQAIHQRDALRAELDELRQDVRAVVEDPDRVLAVLDGAPATAPLPTEPICLGCGVDNCEHVTTLTRHEQVKRLALDLETVDPYTFKSAATILVERGWRKETR